MISISRTYPLVLPAQAIRDRHRLLITTTARAGWVEVTGGCILGIGIPALGARCPSRRVAAWRSIRTPAQLRKIGPR